jgi:hypothetical protein
MAFAIPDQRCRRNHAAIGIVQDTKKSGAQMGLFWKILLFPLLFLLGLVAVGSIAQNAPELALGIGLGAGFSIIRYWLQYQHCKKHNLVFKPRGFTDSLARQLTASRRKMYHERLRNYAGLR